MAIRYAYEPAYRAAGWFDDDARTIPGWFDRDLVEDTPKTLVYFLPDFFDDADIFYVPPPITVVVFASFFDDQDIFYVPASMRALGAPDVLLANEVRRIR